MSRWGIVAFYTVALMLALLTGWASTVLADRYL
jgi:hypothetical protein